MTEQAKESSDPCRLAQMIAQVCGRPDSGYCPALDEMLAAEADRRMAEMGFIRQENESFHDRLAGKERR